MIRLNVFISVAEANRATILDAAKELTAYSLTEEGCIAYDVFESATRPDVLMICETWKDTATLTAHSQSEVFLRNIALLQGLATIKLEKFEF